MFIKILLVFVVFLVKSGFGIEDEFLIYSTQLKDSECIKLQDRASNITVLLDDIKTYLIHHNNSFGNKTSVENGCKKIISEKNRNSETEKYSNCPEWHYYQCFKRLGLPIFSEEELTKDKREFLINFTSITIHRYFTNSTPNDTEPNVFYHRFADFLYKMGDLSRNDFCSRFEPIGKNSTCYVDQYKYEYKTLCHSSEPEKLTHFLLKVIVTRIKDDQDAIAVLKPLKFLGQRRSEFIDDLAKDVSKLKELTSQQNLLRIFKIPLARELMTSNLLLNNFGRTLRHLYKELQIACIGNRTDTILQQLELECENKSRFERKTRTISASDFEFHLFLEDVHIAIRVVLLTMILFSNSYTYLNLRISSKTMEYTSIQLIRFMLFANILFFFSELWLLYESFVPIIPQKGTIEFTFDDDYNFDLWEKTTYFLNMESVRMILGYRYKNEEIASIMRILLILQNVLINISRIYAATILVAIMCCVLYDVRKSFGGQSTGNSKMNKIMKIILITSFSIVTVSYITTGWFLYELMKNISHALTDENVDCDQKNFEAFSIRAHSYLMAVFFIITIFAAFTLFCYHKIEETIVPFISKIVQEEMQKTTANLLFATGIYIFSNSIIIFYEISIQRWVAGENIKNAEIVRMSVTYHWLYFFTFIDPIFHPIIIISRFKAMKQTQQRWRRKINTFKFSRFLRLMIIRIYHKMYPDRCHEQVYKQVVDKLQYFPSLSKERAVRYRVASIHSEKTCNNEQEIKNMLAILAKQRSFPNDM